MPKMPMWLLLLFLLCLVLAKPAAANELYRCLGAHQAVSYQSQACATGQRLDRMVAYQRDAVSARAQLPLLTTRAPRYVAHNPRYMAPRTSRHTTARNQCHASKAKREAALQRLGMSRTFAQLSQLDAPVREACHGF
jgi:hypothetical protein